MPWQGFYLSAFETLRFDRQYGAMGGETPISYQAISMFAHDHGIAGAEFSALLTFVRAIDACYLDKAARDAEAKRRAK